MLTCPACEQPIRPGQPVAIVKVSDRRTVVLHLEPCCRMLLVLVTSTVPVKLPGGRCYEGGSS
jgi:hypothetical protein